MTTSEYESLRDRYLKFFPESLFAANLQTYEEECREFQKDGIQTTPLERHFDAGEDVYFDIIPFLCGCGEPELVVQVFFIALQSRAWTDENGKWHNPIPIDEDGSRTQEALHLTLLYILDHLGYTDHGSSVYSSWLTPKGIAARDILKAYFDYKQQESQQ